MLAVIIETKYMYSVEHNDVFIASVATSCGRSYYHQANAVQNFNGWLHVLHKMSSRIGSMYIIVSIC
jgi:hypothetical protein